jgi:hypothetical protein
VQLQRGAGAARLPRPNSVDVRLAVEREIEMTLVAVR